MDNNWDDETIMPFGAHKGKALANVPADYLLWAFKQGWSSYNARMLYAYIKENMDALKLETK